MAITQTNKLGLPLYSAGTDPHPGRIDHNSIMQAINDNAMGVKQGLHASRPGAGVAGRTYFSTDRSTMSYDTGTTWAEYVPIGGVDPSGVRAGATGPVLSAAGGTEGTSARLARADHTHALPLATDDLPGLLNADMYYLLARMTDAATPSTLVRRDAAARISVGTPTSAVHAATKAYADLVASNASNLTTGTVAVARLPLATGSTAGAMSAAHYSLVQGATASNTPEAIVQRNSYGHIDVNRVILQADPTVPTHATHKAYVDTQVASRALSSHNHSAADTISGVFDPARLPLATASAAGALSASDKAKLDGATSQATGSRILMRNSDGDATLNQLVISAAAPTSGAHATRKDYVDGRTVTGQVSMNASANVATTANITFPPGQFSVTPAIVVTPYGAQGSFDGPVTLTNVSLTGATINFTRKIAGTVVIAWAAIA